MYPEVELLCDVIVLFLLFIQFLHLLTFPPMVQKTPVSFLMKEPMSCREVWPETHGAGAGGDLKGFPKVLTCAISLASTCTLHTPTFSDPGLVSLSTEAPMPSANPSLVTPASEVLFHGLHRHCHYRVPFHFSSCPPLSLSIWAFPKSLSHSSASSHPASLAS